MSWKKLVETKDLIVFERSLGKHKVKIEARKAEDFGWEVFKTVVDNNSASLVSEYSLNTKEEVRKLIEKLKKEKDRPKRKMMARRSVRVSLKRAFKEEFVEKWYFSVGNDKGRNFTVVKFDEALHADIVMHERFRHYERQIIAQIEEKLGLKELGDSIKYEIYYFRKSHSDVQNEAKEHNMDLMDIEFDYSDDEDF